MVWVYRTMVQVWPCIGLKKREAEVASAVDLPEKFIAIAPGAAFYTKTWPCHRFVELAKQLIQQYGISIVWLGGPKERALNDCLREAGDTHTSNLIGQLSLLQNALFCKKPLY
jgi:ADP-heptose:LPS heptosyltransferase